MNFSSLKDILNTTNLDNFKKKRKPEIKDSEIFSLAKRVVLGFFSEKEIKIERIEKGTLFITTGSSSVNQRVFWRKMEILKKINSFFDSEKVKDIRVRVR